jgi:hypothetical protein
MDRATPNGCSLSRDYLTRLSNLTSLITRQRRSMEPTTIQLTGLSMDDVTTLAEAGVTNSMELMSLTHEDVCAILPGASFLKKRKLSNVAKYLASGQIIDANTEMADILRYLSNKAKPAPIQLSPPVPPAYQPAEPGSTTAPPELKAKRVRPQRFSQPRKNAKLTTAHGGPSAEELHQYFLDEQKAVFYLRDHGVIDCILNCPHCGVKLGSSGKYPNDGCWTMQCSKRKPGCSDGGKRWKQSIFKNSVLSNCRKPKNEFFHFLFLWVHKTPPNEIKTILGWTWNSLDKWCKHLRKMCALSMSDDNGPGVAAVEMDESKVFDGYKREIPDTAANKPKRREHLFEQMWRKQHEDDLWFGLLKTLAKTKHHNEVTPEI